MGIVFSLLHLFILSGVISPLISSSILSTYWPGEFYLSVSYLFAFSYCSWGSQGKNTEVVCHSLLQWTTFCQTSLPWAGCLGWPHTAWLSFTELDKLWSMWSDWPVVCDCGFCLSALWHTFSVPTVLLGILLPWIWGIFSRLFQQSAATAPYLGRVTLPDLECGAAPLGLSCATVSTTVAGIP